MSRYGTAADAVYRGFDFGMWKLLEPRAGDGTLWRSLMAGFR
jgi:hypothetical protein